MFRSVCIFRASPVVQLFTRAQVSSYGKLIRSTVWSKVHMSSVAVKLHALESALLTAIVIAFQFGMESSQTNSIFKNFLTREYILGHEVDKVV